MSDTLDICRGCDQPEGTGTLLDFRPDPPPAAVELGVTLDTWRRFAERYRCPLCANGGIVPA